MLLSLVTVMAKSQEAVTFPAGDGLKVRGDLYLRDNSLPFIILCHQAASNRSEFYEIAPRLLNLEYNCLAIDLRAGGKVGFTENETALQAAAKKVPADMLDARSDVSAAIDFVQHLNRKPVILLGSSCSASLCLLMARNDQRIQAVVALSPGEYFQPRINMEEEIRGFGKPLFISGTQSEYSYLQRMTSHLQPGSFTLFKPEKSQGEPGTRALSQEGEARDEYWFALLLFFKEVIR